MNLLYRIIKDFWNTALITWLILVMMELSRPGTVQRFINLEYWLYGLGVGFLILLVKK